MTRTQLLLVASILILIGFVLLIIGLPDSDILWMLGLGVVGAAMLASLATHWVGDEEDEEEEDEEDNAEENEEQNGRSAAGEPWNGANQQDRESR